MGSLLRGVGEDIFPGALCPRQNIGRLSPTRTNWTDLRFLLVIFLRAVLTGRGLTLTIVFKLIAEKLAPSIGSMIHQVNMFQLR